MSIVENNTVARKVIYKMMESKELKHFYQIILVMDNLAMKVCWCRRQNIEEELLSNL